MSVMLGKLYTALKAAGADERSAEEAATEVAGYENRLAKIETDLTLLKWMVTTNVGLTLIILGKLFFQ